MDRLSRRFLIEVTKSGELRIRDRREKTPRRARSKKQDPDVGLPIYSVSTREEAERLQVRLCVLERDDNKTYRLNRRYRDRADGHLELDDLPTITDLLERTHKTQTKQYAESVD